MIWVFNCEKQWEGACVLVKLLGRNNKQLKNLLVLHDNF